MRSCPGIVAGWRVVSPGFVAGRLAVSGLGAAGLWFTGLLLVTLVARSTRVLLVVALPSLTGCGLLILFRLAGVLVIGAGISPIRVVFLVARVASVLIVPLSPVISSARLFRLAIVAVARWLSFFFIFDFFLSGEEAKNTRKETTARCCNPVFLLCCRRWQWSGWRYCLHRRGFCFGDLHLVSCGCVGGNLFCRQFVAA